MERVSRRVRERDFPSLAVERSRRIGHEDAVVVVVYASDVEVEARLDALPGWTWKPHGERWEEGFAALRAFVAREDNVGGLRANRKHN